MRALTMRCDATGEVAPAHAVGTTDDGATLYQWVDGWTPTVDHDTDGDTWWAMERCDECSGTGCYPDGLHRHPCDGCDGAGRRMAR